MLSSQPSPPTTHTSSILALPPRRLSTINKLLKPSDNTSNSFTENKCNYFLSFFQTKINSSLTTTPALSTSPPVSPTFTIQPVSVFPCVYQTSRQEWETPPLSWIPSHPTLLKTVSLLSLPTQSSPQLQWPIRTISIWFLLTTQHRNSPPRSHQRPPPLFRLWPQHSHPPWPHSSIWHHQPYHSSLPPWILPQHHC